VVRVLLDATALPADRGGVGRYVDELVARLPGLGADLHVAAQPRDEERYSSVVGRAHVHLAPGWANKPPPRLAWEQTGLPLLVRRIRPDVVHSPHYTMPLAMSLSRRPRQVVTLHDATFFSLPQLHLARKARFFAQWIKVATRRADALIVPSRATLDEVVEHTGVDPARVTVIPHGVDHDRFQPPTPHEVTEVRKWLGLEPDTAYCAFLGTLEPRKNVPALIRAFASACTDLPVPPALVLAGGRGWDTGIDTALAQVPAHLTVLLPGFVPEPLVPALLGGAEVVAYPGFGEGFGLPVLEAMACGAPVLTTRRLSLPEVGGDAVAYASSPDDADLASALASLLADPNRRRELSAAGVKRAAGYTWTAAAAAHLAVFESPVKG
jgi:glycosyltransferase involved in cell wall biosynthesis